MRTLLALVLLSLAAAPARAGPDVAALWGELRGMTIEQVQRLYPEARLFTPQARPPFVGRRAPQPWFVLEGQRFARGLSADVKINIRDGRVSTVTLDLRPTGGRKLKRSDFNRLRKTVERKFGAAVTCNNGMYTTKVVFVVAFHFVRDGTRLALIYGERPEGNEISMTYFEADSWWRRFPRNGKVDCAHPGELYREQPPVDHPDLRGLRSALTWPRPPSRPPRHDQGRPSPRR